MEKLSSQNGFHMLTMKEFLDREGVTGGLHGKVPPGNDSTIWGNKLWNYLKQVSLSNMKCQINMVIYLSLSMQCSGC